MASNLIAAAKAATSKYGLSVIPIAGHDWTDANDGASAAKHPYWMNGRGPVRFQWLPYQERLMEVGEIERFFAKTPNIALVCGHVSGGLEVIDFDEPGLYEAWVAIMDEHGYGEIAGRLVIQSTLSPGRFHAIYRCTETVEPGRKIAMRDATPEELQAKPDQKTKCTIETRGDKQYILCAPSEGYRLLRGKLSAIPVVTAEERGAMLATARILSELDTEEIDYRPQSKASTGGDLRPGSDFNERADWSEVIAPHGWTFARQVRNLLEWVRPGKERRQGIGAVSGLGRSGQDLLRVHSTNAYPLDGGRTYDKFGAYTALEHGGDYAAATKALAAKGYGQQRPGQASKTREANAAPADAGPKTKGEHPSDVNVSQPATSKPVFRFYSPSDLASMPPKPMLIDGLIGVQDRFMIYGLPGVGKTFIVTELLISCAVGGTFALDFQSVRPLRVIYCTNEGKFGYPARLKACLAQNGLTFTEIQDNLRVCYDMPQLSDMKSPRAIRAFADEYEKLNPDGGDILILDTLNKATLGSDEIDNSAAAVACDALAEIGDRLHISSGLIHHPSKAHTDPRGASAFIGDMDCILRVFREDGSPHSSLSLYKGKDIPAFDDIAFKLEAGHGSAVVRWLGSGGFANDSEDKTALSAAVLLMRANPSREWWSLTALSRESGRDYDTCRMALQRESAKPQGLVERQGSGDSVEYRRRAL